MHPSLNRKRNLVDDARLDVLRELVMARMDDVFAGLGVSLTEERRGWFGCCPVHCGDNRQALYIYRGGLVPGKWLCFTRQCEQTFRRTIFGFIQGVLSAHKGWEPGLPAGRLVVPFQEVISFCCQTLSVDYGQIRVDAALREKQLFVREVEEMAGPAPVSSGLNLTRQSIRARLQVPAQYFVGRGYSSRVLDEFDVGFCGESSKPFTGRVVVPCYGPGGVVLGFTARSVYEECQSCNSWHAPGLSCPQTDDEFKRTAKWTHSAGFHTNACLYNLGRAEGVIRKTGRVLLVEGARLCVAMCGGGL